MTNQRQQLGSYGETLAADYLQEQGYTIITTNWHCSHGELDIVAQQGEVLVFVEVKTRRSVNTQSAFANITPNKQEKLIAAVYLYLSENDQENVHWRIDAIAVAIPPRGAPVIKQVEDALGW